MTILNNQNRLKETRQELRNNCTESEKYLWEYFKGSKYKGLKFRRQHSVGRYILDFYCPKLKLAIELDGEIHSGREEYDNIRTEFLNLYGIKVIRFPNNEILSDINLCLAKI